MIGVCDGPPINYGLHSVRLAPAVPYLYPLKVGFTITKSKPATVLGAEKMVVYLWTPS